LKLLALFFVSLCIISSLPLVSADVIPVTTEDHYMVLIKGQTLEFTLSGNPTTGCTWWIQDTPVDVIVTFARKEPGTLECPINVGGCGQEFTVYSIASNSVNEYTVQFRFGHDWNHDEYYIIAYLHIWVVNSANTWITSILHKDATGYYFIQGDPSFNMYLNFKYYDLEGWAEMQRGNQIRVRVTSPGYVVVEAQENSIVITTTVKVTSNQTIGIPSSDIIKILRDIWNFIKEILSKVFGVMLDFTVQLEYFISDES